MWVATAQTETSSAGGSIEAVLVLFATVIESLGWATAALLDQDVERADRVIADDRQVDLRCDELTGLIKGRLSDATVEPDELEDLIAILQMVPELERSADLAEHIAQRTRLGLGGTHQPPQPRPDPVHVRRRRPHVAADQPGLRRAVRDMQFRAQPRLTTSSTSSPRACSLLGPGTAPTPPWPPSWPWLPASTSASATTPSTWRGASTPWLRPAGCRRCGSSRGPPAGGGGRGPRSTGWHGVREVLSRPRPL